MNLENKPPFKFASDSSDLARWLNLAVVYTLPALMLALAFAAAITTWGPERAANKQLLFKVGSHESWTEPAQVARALENASPVEHFDTKRSVAPFWFLFSIEPSDQIEIELPSRHAVNAECWAGPSFTQSLGAADRSHTKGQLSYMRAGFRLSPRDVKGTQVLCRSEFQGPARISVVAWENRDLSRVIERFSNLAGFLDGAGVLAFFLFAVALSNREPLYALLGMWLLGNLRIGALSAGMDFSWLGYQIPSEWLYGIRKFTFASYYILTIWVFGGLFGEGLTSSVRRKALRVMQISMLPVALAALFLPYGSFLPVLWLGALIAGVTEISLLITFPRQHRSLVTLAFGGALAVTLAGSLSEVLAAATGWKDLLFYLNNVTGALTGSALGAIAVAAHVRKERQQRQDAQQTALKALKKVSDTYRASPIGLFTMDKHGALVRYNPAFEAMLGLTKNDAQIDVWKNNFSATAVSKFIELNVGESAEVEVAAFNARNEQRWYHIKLFASELGDVEGSLQDITDRKVAEDRLRFLADHDPLTELLNRRGIEQALERTFSQLKTGAVAALAYIDLDRFKLVNDLYGHPAGDDVLRQLTKRLVEAVKTYPIARVGGDEFVVVFDQLGVEEARTVCRQIIDEIRLVPFSSCERLVRIEASIGLVEVTLEMSGHDAIAAADQACREAKRDPSAGLVVYQRGDDQVTEHTKQLALIERIASGTVANGLHIEMQPIMSLSAPFESLNFEVLLRMRDHDGAAIPTFKLIQAAETSGMMPVIDRWMLHQTLSWLDTHRARLRRTQFVCVNLSGVSLNDERFVADTLAMLAEFKNVAKMICLEITETVALHDLMNTRRWIDKLRQHGVKVALDDFGAGYSSFSYLRDLPADALKIDGAFVKTINEHASNHSIVQAIVELARNLGMRTIAEWAEDRQVLEALAGLGADYAQGWAIARSQPPEEILKASSAADFITDEATLRSVQDFADKSRWGAFKEQLFPLGATRGR